MEVGGILDDPLPDAHLFKIKVIVDQFVEVMTYLMIGHVLDEWTIVKKK